MLFVQPCYQTANAAHVPLEGAAALPAAGRPAVPLHSAAGRPRRRPVGTSTAGRRSSAGRCAFGYTCSAGGSVTESVEVAGGETPPERRPVTSISQRATNKRAGSAEPRADPRSGWLNLGAWR